MLSFMDVIEYIDQGIIMHMCSIAKTAKHYIYILDYVTAIEMQ